MTCFHSDLISLSPTTCIYPKYTMIHMQDFILVFVLLTCDHSCVLLLFDLCLRPPEVSIDMTRDIVSSKAFDTYQSPQSFS